MAKYVSNGTYGCVMNPAVSCSGKLQDKHVSKIFKTEVGAIREYIEHKNIVEKLDPKGEFTVVAHENCSISGNHFKKQVHLCTNFKSPEMTRDMHPQIVYDNGGIDLTGAMRQVTFEELFIAMRSIFKGLVELKAKKYSHLDIKPANIVYNKDTKKMALIDFGLAQKNANVLYENNMHLFTHPYKYYPPEFDLYAQYFKMSDDVFAARFKAKKLGPSKNFNFFKPLISWKVDTNEIYDIELEKLHLYVDRIDTYMFGVTIAELLRHYNKNAANRKFYNQVNELIKKMTYYAPHLRITPEQALVEYKKIIHTKFAIPDSVPRSKSIHDSPGVAHAAVEAAQAAKPAKPCPPGKIRNPKTGRCIIDKATKAAKAAPEAAQAAQSAKPCPPGKIRNPKTGRCIIDKATKAAKAAPEAAKSAKPCPPGKIRNPKTGRCIIDQAAKAAKPCPPGKIRNPKTGRCIIDKATKAAKAA
jgi:serine/threonine protein kinase